MGKSIVNAHSFKMDPSPPLALTPDSCWIQHSRAFTGTGCHSSPPTTAAPVHTHTQHVRAYVHSRLSAACTRSRFKGLCSQAHPLLYPLSISPFLILSLSLSPFIPLPLFLPPPLPPPPFTVSLTLLSSLTPLCLALGTADYLALVQNVIKENDQLPQLPPSFLPSALSLSLSLPFFFFFKCLSVFLLTLCYVLGVYRS